MTVIFLPSYVHFYESTQLPESRYKSL